MGCCFSEPVDFESEVTLYHFDLHRAVGKGAFGKVGPYFRLPSLSNPYRCGSSSTSAPRSYMPSNISTKPAVYVRRLLRTLSKSVVSLRRSFVFSRLQRPMRLILLQIDHPFIVNLRYAFQDDENCFFVLDLMLGGDLRCMSPIYLYFLLLIFLQFIWNARVILRRMWFVSGWPNSHVLSNIFTVSV